MSSIPTAQDYSPYVLQNPASVSSCLCDLSKLKSAAGVLMLAGALFF